MYKVPRFWDRAKMPETRVNTRNLGPQWYQVGRRRAETMRKKPGSKASIPQVEPEWTLVPCSEWTREGELEGWDRETGDRTVSEILADIGATGMIWFESDPERGIALTVEPGFEVPGDIMTRLRDNREGIIRWWTSNRTRYEPLEATKEA